MWSRNSNGNPWRVAKGYCGWAVWWRNVSTSLSIPKLLLCRSLINSCSLNVVDLRSTDLPRPLISSWFHWASLLRHCLLPGLQWLHTPVLSPIYFSGLVTCSIPCEATLLSALCPHSSLKKSLTPDGKDALVHLSPPFISAPDLWTQLPTESSNPWKSCLHLIELFVSFSRDLLFFPLQFCTLSLICFPVFFIICVLLSWLESLLYYWSFWDTGHDNFPWGCLNLAILSLPCICSKSLSTDHLGLCQRIMSTANEDWVNPRVRTNGGGGHACPISSLNGRCFYKASAWVPGLLWSVQWITLRKFSFLLVCQEILFRVCVTLISVSGLSWSNPKVSL